MNNIGMYLRIRLYKVIAVTLIAATAGTALAYFHTSNTKYESLLAGLCTGLLVAVIQFALDYNEHAEIETMKKLGIQKILPYRDDRAYYQQLLAASKRQILVLGNTASRFLEDFAHPDRADSRVLFEALARGVSVRILLPAPNVLPDSDRAKAEQSKLKLEGIASLHQNLQFRYFSHPPVHSIFKVDDDCLVGPIFPHVRSKDSPTIHAYVYSPLVAEYLRYFEREWDAAANS